MRKGRKHLPWLFLLCVACIVVLGIGMSVQAATGKTIKTVTVKVSGKKVNGTTISLQKGKSMALQVSTSPKLSRKTVSYKSSSTSVVSVNSKGKLTAKKEGTAKISVTVKASGYKKKTVSLNVKVPGADTGTNTGEDKTLVVYFSCTNTTKGVAEKIAAAANADLYEIQAKVPYTEADLDYAPSRSATEQGNPSTRPEISGSVSDFDSYSLIYLGFPIWDGDEPRIIDTFLESYDFSGKTIVPFCTSGGSGISASVNNIKKLVPKNTTVLGGKRFEGNVSQAEIEAWVSGQ